MRERAISGIALLTLCLVSLLTTAQNIPLVRASGTIYIRADGSIDPPDAPIRRDGSNYTLIDDIASNIGPGDRAVLIERSNIILDGMGHTIQGSGKGMALHLEGRSNVTVRNLEIDDFNYGVNVHSSMNCSLYNNKISSSGGGGNGIWLGYSNNSRLVGNQIANFTYGVRLWSSSDNVLSGNTFVNDGLVVSDSFRTVAVDNLVNCRPLVYLENVSNRVVEDAGQVVLVNCSRISVEYLNLYDTSVGIQMWNTNNSYLCGNHMRNNLVGFWLGSSSKNILIANYITDCKYGIDLYQSTGNIVYSNNVEANVNGIWTQDSSGNQIYSNSFVNNEHQAFSTSEESVNEWDDGYYTGNYWSDYNGTDLYCGRYQNESGSDGRGDTPYVIDGKNKDHYPSMYNSIPSQYALKVYPSMGGTTTPLPGRYVYLASSRVTVTATAIASGNYLFLNWVLDGRFAGSMNPIEVFMNCSHDLWPVFVRTYTLRIFATGTGMTTPAPGTYVYTANSSVQITAVPNQGYKFDHWIFDGQPVGSANPIDLEMNCSHTLLATFSIEWEEAPTLSVNPSFVRALQGSSVQVNVSLINASLPAYRWAICLRYDSTILRFVQLTYVGYSEVGEFQGVGYIYWEGSGPPELLGCIEFESTRICGKTRIDYDYCELFDQEGRYNIPFKRRDCLVTICKPHDLAVSVDAPRYLNGGERVLLNATVINTGNNDEANVTIFLFIDGEVVNHSVVSNLPVDSCFTISYWWAPQSLAFYNVSAYAPPTSGENSTGDNAANAYVNGPCFVSMCPLVNRAGIGCSFTVNITISVASQLWGWQAKLCFDPAILNVARVWIPQDSIFENDADYVSEPVIGDGYIMIAAAVFHWDRAFTGVGTLCSIEFVVLRESNSTLSLDACGTIFLNETGGSISYFKEDGFLYGGMLGDVNRDGKVDLKDVYALGKAYGSYSGHPRWNPFCDLNDDGKIDLKDYFTVCKNYGKSW